MLLLPTSSPPGALVPAEARCSGKRAERDADLYLSIPFNRTSISRPDTPLMQHRNLCHLETNRSAIENARPGDQGHREQPGLEGGLNACACRRLQNRCSKQRQGSRTSLRMPRLPLLPLLSSSAYPHPSSLPGKAPLPPCSVVPPSITASSGTPSTPSIP
ncbi:unnamed protein product [Mortierella alpina]